MVESNDFSSSRDEQNGLLPTLDAVERQRKSSVRSKEEWLSLLEARRFIQSADDMSTWLMRVFAISEQCATVKKNNFSSDDKNNNEKSPTNKEITS
jgi:hypothetical protein